MNSATPIVRLWIVVLWLVVVPLVLVGACNARMRIKWKQFATLEQRAKEVVTPEELQGWANQILAEYPNYSAIQHRQLATNCPAKLRSLLWGGGPHVFVQPAYQSESDADLSRAAHVVVAWSFKPSGEAAFEIGPSNFVSYSPNAREWAPGVYFYSK